jgi:uncharacterized protein YrrD
MELFLEGDELGLLEDVVFEIVSARFVAFVLVQLEILAHETFPFLNHQSMLLEHFQ